MSASFCASFLMTIVTYVVMFDQNKKGFTGERPLDLVIYVALLLNALYFYAFGAISEQNKTFQTFIFKRRWREWPLRVASNVLILTLPFFWEFGDTANLLRAMFVFYLILYAWDAAVYIGRSAAELKAGPPNPFAPDVIGGVGTMLLAVGLSAFAIILRQQPAVPLSPSITAVMNRDYAMAMIGGSILAYLFSFVWALVVGFPVLRQAFRIVY